MKVRLNFPGLTNRKRSDIVDKRSLLPSLYGSWSQGVPLSRSSSDRLTFDPSEALNAFQASEVAYRCVDLAASSLAALDLVVVNDGQIDESDPIANRFNKSSTDAESAVLFKRIVWMRLEQMGECFVYMDRGESGEEEPKDFAIIYERVTVKKRERFLDEDGMARPLTKRERIVQEIEGFTVETPFGPVPLLPSEVLWFRYPHFSARWQTMAPGSAATVPAGLDWEARKWQANEFANQARPSGVYNAGPMTQERVEALKAKIESEATGPRNAGRVLVLYGNDGKTGFDRISLTPAEMSYIETHKMNGADLCLAYGIPVDLVFGQSTYDNQHAAWTRAWATWQGKLAIVEGEIDRQLYPEPLQRAQFDLRKVEALQENQNSIVERVVKVADSDLTTIDESREMIGLKAIGDERGRMTQTEFRAWVNSQSDSVNISQQNPQNTNTDETSTKTNNNTAAVAHNVAETRASTSNSKGVIASFWIDEEQASDIAIEGGESAQKLHLTLAYLGKTSDDLNREEIERALGSFAESHTPITGCIGGKGIFQTEEDGDAVVGLVDAPGLSQWRSELVQALEDAGIEVNKQHDFLPHITFAYTDPGESGEVEIPLGAEFMWSDLTFAWGDEHVNFPLAKQEAARFQKRSDDSQTVDRVLRMYDRHERLIKRAVVRLAEKQRRVVLRNLAKKEDKRSKASQRAEEIPTVTVEDIFDKAFWIAVTAEMLEGPMESMWTDAAAQAAESIGEEITDVFLELIINQMRERLDFLASEVTQTTYNTIRNELLKEGVEQGEGIPKLADRIKNIFQGLETWRAELIARTETLGGTNHAAFLMAKDSGLPFKKKWYTAKDDRVRETHEKLHKDIKEMDEKFDNGLRFPGDPLGLPEETIQCRCVLLFLLDGDEDARKSTSEAGTFSQDDYMAIVKRAEDG